MSEKMVNHRPLRAKLIFNEISGQPDESPTQLTDNLTEMQKWNILSEVYMVHPDSQVESVVRSAIKGGVSGEPEEARLGGVQLITSDDHAGLRAARLAVFII